MMKPLLCLAVLLTLLIPISAADPPPPLPNSFSGKVRFSNSSGVFDAPSGTLIEVFMDNIMRKSTNVTTAGSYRIDILGTYDDDGKTMRFKVDHVIAEDGVVFNANNPPPRILGFVINTDTSPPASITDLRNISYAQYYINWTWSDPSDPDFSGVMVYINGVFRTNVTKGTQYYSAIDLTQGTTYTIGTRTYDTSGNINLTWVNHTSTTSQALSGYGSINGTVLDRTTRTGISAAIVTADTGNMTITDASGFYSLNVTAGAHVLTTTAEPRYYSNGSVSVTAISNTTVVQDIELISKPMGTISGSVTEA